MPVFLARAPLRTSLRLRLLSPLHQWHLLSLDAPTIATLWTVFLARAAGLRLPPSTLMSMFLAVWILYAADRLLDARLLTAHPLLPAHQPCWGMEARHLFHHRHRSAFLLALIPAAVALACLLPRLDPAAVRLQLGLGSLLAGYFIVIHATGAAANLPEATQRLPKELAVGPFFAAACSVPTVARLPDERAALLPGALMFAALCSLNCLVIYSAEHRPRRDEPMTKPHPLTRLAVRHLRLLAATLLALAAMAAVRGPAVSRPAAVATLLSTALLLCLQRARGVASLTARALADLALATPLLLLPFLHA